MSAFMVIIVVLMSNGQYQTTIPTGNVYLDVRHCIEEGRQYANDSGVQINCKEVSVYQ